MNDCERLSHTKWECKYRVGDRQALGQIGMLLGQELCRATG
jgi:hypothetical protein